MKRKIIQKDSAESPIKKKKLGKDTDASKAKLTVTKEIKGSKNDPKNNPDANVKKTVKQQGKNVSPQFNKFNKSNGPKAFGSTKSKKPVSNGKGQFEKNVTDQENAESWADFKKKKKELKLKRKQVRAKEGFDILVKAKRMGEDLRKKNLKGGEQKRVQLINELHSLLKTNNLYKKFVLAHDTARLVQWLLKYASNFVIQQIAQEIIPATMEMMQSKYGIHCVKRLLKYGSTDIRKQIIDAMFGNAVKLASHSVSAPVLEYAYTTWATPVQKQYLVQEFFGDIYKNSKDDSIKHLKDAYATNETLKTAILGATKTNIQRILNKNLLDSGLVQTVISQYLTECTEENRTELITELAPHIVVISNSKDGARAAMNCIWHGTNKDKKVIMKTMKEHIVELSKHEHGYCVVITLLDSIDDTVLLHKILLPEILNSAKDLAISEWGRKVLLWLVAPADSTKFHPVFISELNQGRDLSTSKKSPELRRKEILECSITILLELIINEAEFWLSTASLATEMTAIVKVGTGDKLVNAYDSIVDVITSLEWKIKEKDSEMLGIEHPGMHMMLKKLAQHDKTNLEKDLYTFGEALVKKLDSDLLSTWLTLNRGCFLLITVSENGSQDTQTKLKEKLKKHTTLLKKQKTAGAKILLKKL